MVIDRFPPVELADENGLLAIGGDLDVDTLLLAYRSGIFPWPISEEYPLAWFSPNPRGILKFENLHISKSLQKQIKKSNFEISINQKFDHVIYQCAYIENRKGQTGTWITPAIINAYSQLHQAGHAYSIEIMQDNKLVGGMYGIHQNDFLCGESMYFFESGASKTAIVFLMHLLNKHGITWLDTQMVTPVVSDLGGIEIPRRDFISNLKKLIQAPSKPIFEKTHYTHQELIEILNL